MKFLGKSITDLQRKSSLKGEIEEEKSRSSNDVSEKRRQIKLIQGNVTIKRPQTRTDKRRAEIIQQRKEEKANRANQMTYGQTERAKRMIRLQRKAFENYLLQEKPEKIEVFEDYLKELKACDMSYGEAPSSLVEPRIRRKIMEGSYPNWTVEEDKLPNLLRYVWKGKVMKLKHYFEDKTKHDKVNREDDRGRTALHYAASWGCIKRLNILLNIPGIDLNKRDEHDKTPLHKAVEINSMECARALIEAGANPRITARDTRDPMTTILHYYGDTYFQMFKFLYEQGNYDSDEIHSYSMTLLHKAIGAEEGTVNLKIVDFLIKKGCDVLDKEGKSRTPIHLAVIYGRTDILYLLLAHCYLNVFCVDDDMKLAIDYAAENSLLKAILDEYYEYGPPTVDKAITCRKPGDDLNISSVLCKYHPNKSW